MAHRRRRHAARPPVLPISVNIAYYYCYHYYKHTKAIRQSDIQKIAEREHRQRITKKTCFWTAEQTGSSPAATCRKAPTNNKHK